AEKEIETIPTTIPADQVPHLKSVGYIDLEEQIKKSKEKKEEVISQTSAKEKELTTKQKIQLKEEKLPETIIPEKEKVTNIETTVSPKIELEEIKKEKTTVEKKEKILVAEVEEKEKTVEPKKISSKIKAESAEKVEKQQISHEVEEKNLIGREEIFTAKIEETAENEEENEIFEIAHPILDTNLTVIGTIDLDAINQSTRPKSKSKEQKKKEYAEKNRLLNESKKFAPSKSKKIIKLSEEETDEVELDEFKEQHKKKRARFTKQKVDIAKIFPNGTSISTLEPPKKVVSPKVGKGKLKKTIKPAISEEEVQKQIKETLARLSAASSKKGKSAKYRRDKREMLNARQQELAQREQEEEKVLKLTEFVTVNELANLMDVTVNDVIATCMNIGMIVSINQRLDAETINILADEFGYKVQYISQDILESVLEEEPDRE
ncbi:MAG TPA: translation initiation factor IF-2 N-terminal domain-containing protein, partial [Paludibacteraceae bacterium]|nr:translation initiation factor IF-2 N-terminal domain-containing protein [Paludibacteraceae bacterium]